MTNMRQKGKWKFGLFISKVWLTENAELFIKFPLKAGIQQDNESVITDCNNCFSWRVSERWWNLNSSVSQMKRVTWRCESQRRLRSCASLADCDGETNDVMWNYAELGPREKQQVCCKPQMLDDEMLKQMHVHSMYSSFLHNTSSRDLCGRREPRCDCSHPSLCYLTPLSSSTQLL